MDFDVVLRAAQAGSEDAFASLYREFNPRVVRYLAAFAPMAAEDLAAETWMGAAGSLRRFRGQAGEFRAWLFTIAHRRLVQHWRDGRRRLTDPADPATFPERRARDDVESQVLDLDVASAAVRRIRDALSPDQAEVVLLRILGELSVDQVGAALGKRPGTVRVLQHKALRKLAAADFSVEAVTP